MSLTSDEIDQLARLSRLALSEEERGALGAQLNTIIAYVEQLEEVDVSDVAPMIHLASSRPVLREDEVQDGVGRGGLAAPSGVTNDMVRVPKIIE